MCQQEGRNWQTEFKKHKVRQLHTAYKKFQIEWHREVERVREKQIRNFVYKKGFTYIHNLTYVLKCSRRLPKEC